MAAELPTDDDPFPASPALEDLEPIPLDTQSVLRRCWELFTAQPGLVIAVAVLPNLASWAFEGVQFGIDVGLDRAGDDTTLTAGLLLAAFAALFLGLFVDLFLYAGTVRVYLELARNRPASLAMLVGEGRRTPALFAAVLLYVIAALGIVAPAIVASIGQGQGWWTEKTAVLVAIVNVFVVLGPAIMASVVVPFVPYVIVDRGVGPLAAWREAWQLTYGHKMTVFGITLLSGMALGVVATFTCGIGALVALPAYALIQAVMYDSLRRLNRLTAAL